MAEIKPSKAGNTLPSATQQALRERTHFIPVNPDGTRKAQSRRSEVAQNTSIRTSVDARNVLQSKEGKRASMQVTHRSQDMITPRTSAQVAENKTQAEKASLQKKLLIN